MIERSLLVTDIDGTLLPGGHHRASFDVFPAALAIARAQDRKKQVSLATGRPLDWTKPIIDLFGITTPVIVNNGARVSEPTNGRTLWEKHLPAGAGEKILGFLGEMAASRDIFVNLDSNSGGGFDTVTSGQLQETIYLDLVGVANPTDSHAIARFIGELDGASCAVVASPQRPGAHNILVTHTEGTKYHGLRALQDLLGIEPEQTIAAGNDVNDSPLLAGAGLAVAVTDADPRLIAVADRTIPPAHQHGIAQLIYSDLIPE